MSDFMCGIVGFVDKKSKKEKKEIIKKMADRIKHRGPDAEGYYVDDAVALGHRRLSILDLSKSGAQKTYKKKAMFLKRKRIQKLFFMVTRNTKTNCFLNFEGCFLL